MAEVEEPNSYEQVFKLLKKLRGSAGRFGYEKVSKFPELQKLLPEGEDAYDTYGFVESQLRSAERHKSTELQAAALSILMPGDSALTRLQMTADKSAADQRTIRRWSDKGLEIIARTMVDGAHLLGSVNFMKLSCFYPSDAGPSAFKVFFSSLILDSYPATPIRVKVNNRNVSDQLSLDKLRQEGSHIFRSASLVLQLPDPKDYAPGDAVLDVDYIMYLPVLPLISFETTFISNDFRVVTQALRQNAGLSVRRSSSPSVA